MRCNDVAERLTDLMEGALPEAEEAAALEHLASCNRCETVLSETRDVVELAKEHGRVSLSAEDRSRMLSLVLDVVDDPTEDAAE